MQSPQEINNHISDINAIDESGKTLLTEAVDRKDLDGVRDLLDRGANPNLSGPNTFPPLVRATQNNSPDILAELLKRPGIDVNQYQKNQVTALYVAAGLGHEKIMTELLKCDTLQSIEFNCDGNKFSPLSIAIYEKYENLASLLIKRFPKSIHQPLLTDDQAFYPLYIAAQQGLVLIVKVLLDNGADVEDCCKGPETPLTHALNSKHPLVASLLIQNVPKLAKRPNARGDYPLALAVKHGFHDVVNKLLDDVIPFESPIEEHAAWVFRNIYSYRYPNSNATEHGIARVFHGMSHICRAAIYVPVFANLFRMMGHESALKLTDKDIKLIQIAVLFHDAAREGDGVDEWDNESAQFLYFYLIKLGIEKATAILFAEAIANKDSETSGKYVSCCVTDEGIIWQNTEKKPVNIYQILIHEADCLDIIRARDHFDAEYLFFYKLYHEKAMDYLAQLIVEARSIIRKHGDTRCALQYDKKKEFEQANGYEKSLRTIKDDSYFIIPNLYGRLLNENELQNIPLPNLQYDETQGWDETYNMDVLMRQGNLFVRGISDTPSAIYVKDQTIHDDLEGLVEIERTIAEVELYKAARRKEVDTSSSKDNRGDKHGNPYRSLCMLFPGAGVLASVGYLIAKPNYSSIYEMSDIDCDSGWDKKKDSFFKPRRPKLTQDEVIQKKEDLVKKLKKGGSSRRFRGNFPAAFTEILYDIDQFDAIYFTKDPCRANEVFAGNAEPRHEFTPLLMALYLRQVYENKHGKILPIFEYSPIHGYIKRLPEESLNDEAIIKIWVKICSDYVAAKINLPDIPLENYYQLDCNENLQILAMIGERDSSFLAKRYQLPNIHYSKTLKDRINQAIKKELDDLTMKQAELTRDLLLIARKETQRYLSLYDGKPSIEDNHVRVAMNCKNINKEFIQLFSTSYIKAGDKLSMLMFAVKLGRLDIVKLLVETTTIDIEEKDNQGLTALCYAFKEKDVPIIEYLLSKEANPYVRLDDGCTLFHLAFMPYYLPYSIPKIVSLLLTKQVDVNICDKSGRTPILLALMKFEDAKNVFRNVIPTLLNANPKLSLTLPLKVFKEMWQNISANHWPDALKNAPESFNGMTSLMHAAIYLNNAEVIKLLLDNGVKQKRDCFGFTPIELAKHLNYKVIEWLLQSRPFFNALRNGDISTVEHLLEEGLDPDVKNDEGLTALQVVLSNWLEPESVLGMVKLLLAKNFDVNHCGKEKLPPIFLAAKLQEPFLSEVVDLLLAKGANQEVQLMCKFIRKTYFDGKTPKSLKKAGVNEVGHMTLLHVAVLNESKELVSKLLSYGVEQKKDYCGFTPMELAEYLENEEILKIFEEHQEQKDVVRLC